MWNVEKIVRKGDYLYAVVKNHPRASKYGYVLHHRIVVENHLGRLLNAGEVVHHIDGNRYNNVPENLQVKSAVDHAKDHADERLRDLVDLRCPGCGVTFTRYKNQTHLVKGGAYTTCSRHCRGVVSRKLQLGRETHTLDAAISENVLTVYRGKLRANPEQGDA